MKRRQLRIARYRREVLEKRKHKYWLPVAKRYVRPGKHIIAPKSFNLTKGSGHEVVKFLRAVAITVLRQQLPVQLDFRQTEYFFVPGTILLYAELDRIVSLSTMAKPISIKDPFRRRPREVLKQIGLHNLTGDRSDIVPTREDVVYWKATKGSTQSGGTYGSIVEAIAERANTAHAKQLEVSGLWRSVNEAIANSIDHAYKKPRRDGFAGLSATKWWMFSQIKDGI